MAKLCKAIFLYCVFINFTLCQSTQSAKPLISFGELQKLKLNNYNLRTVEDIEPDQLESGGFLVGNQHSLAHISPSLRVNILAGKENETAFRNGPGYSAYFNIVQDLVQINNGSDIIIADLNNHCIRKVERGSGLYPYVSTFVGDCGRQGYVSDPVSPADARLTHPLKLLHIPKENIFYYLLDKVILKHNLTSDLISLMYKDLEFFTGAYTILMDSQNRYMYVNHAGGVSKFDTRSANWTKVLVAGLDYIPSSTPRKVADGPLLRARFGKLPTGMVWLIQDQVLLVCDYKNALRVVNLEDNDVSTICEGQYSNNPTFRTGGLDKCQVNSPLTAKVIDGVIYIGDSSGPETNRAGHILTLTYSQPKCYPPEAKDLKNVLSFTPNKNEYINKDSIKFRCDNGYGVNSSYDTVTCVRALFDNGTVYGVWDKPLPVCKEAALLKLEPKKGQQSGGTIITLTGIFTEEPQIFVAQEQVLEFTRESTQTITFYMPESQSGLGAVDVEVLLGNPSSESYEYLPNPAVRSINRNSAISREGLEIFFKGNNFDSAYNHTLVFSSVSTSVRAVTNCQLGTSGKTLSCITPDFSEFFDGKAKRSVTTGVEFLTLTATLLLDGKAHIGGQFDFTISDTEPTFDTFKQIMKFDLWNKTTIDLTGSNLDTSLMISDYTVYLKFVESGTQLLCDVTRISQATVVCQPPLNSITIPAHTPNLLADLQVSVAGKNYTIGKVKFFISHVASPVKVDPPSTGLVDIVVPVVVTAVVIIIALLAYLLYKRKQPRPPISQLPRYEDDGNGGLEMILPCELRIKLNDIYIDSSKLSFNPKSEPIGRGNFGKVYLGQLQLKGNVLKTVAVKTLKETADIDMKQLQEFLEEAIFMKDFSHANILVTLGVCWRIGDRPNVVLPYMALGDLGSLLRKPEMLFTNGDLVHFGMQVAKGMEYLTDNKCLHRDLAVRNCLVDDTFLVKIADFGLSRDVYEDSYYRENDTSKPRPVKWMALECLTSGFYNSATEVWSFGVLMWELLTRGSHPYPGISNSEIIQHLQQGYRLCRPMNTDPALFQYIERCWNVDPMKRPNFSEIRETLEGCLLSAREYKFGENTNDEEFIYSYARSLTRLIPEDYHADERYINGGVNVQYVDKDSLPDSYEQPLPLPGTPETKKLPSHDLEFLYHHNNHYTQQKPTSGRTPVPRPRTSLDDEEQRQADVKFSNGSMPNVIVGGNKYIV